MEPYVGADHIWAQTFVSAQRFERAVPALFLDRDGVIVEEVHYLSQPADVRLIDGAAELIRAANDRGIAVVIVTNQSGIARGYFDWQAFGRVQDKMMADLAAATGAFVDAVYACPFHKSGNGPYGVDNHEARKPNAGMLVRAQQALTLDVAQSWIIGDKAGDLRAGLQAGCQGGVHVLTGHGRDEGESEKALSTSSNTFNVHQVESIADVCIKDLFAQRFNR